MQYSRSSFRLVEERGARCDPDHSEKSMEQYWKEEERREGEKKKINFCFSFHCMQSALK